MDLKKIAIAAAVGSFLTVGYASIASAADDAAAAPKCYGVAKAGKNDCAAAGHSCAGQSKMDNAPTDWKKMSAADCAKAGGSTTPPAK